MIPKALSVVNTSYEQRHKENFYNELLALGYTHNEIETAWQKIVLEYETKRPHVTLGVFVGRKIKQAKRGIYEL